MAQQILWSLHSQEDRGFDPNRPLEQLDYITSYGDLPHS